MRVKQALLPYLGSAALVGVATTLGALLVSLTPLNSVSAIYMLPVLVSAVRYGTGPAVLAALLGAVMTSLFYPPIFSVLVVQPAQIVDLVVSLVVALTIGRLAARVRAEMLGARDREQQIRRLYSLGSAMAAASDAQAIYRLIADHMSEALARPVAVFGVTRTGSIEAISQPPIPGGDETLLPEVARLLGSEAQRSVNSTDLVRLPAGGSWLLCRLGDATKAGAVLAVPFGQHELEATEGLVAQARSILAEGSRSLDRLGLTRAVEERNLRRRSDELRDILLESVSHELRTPIAGIMGSASVIAAAPALGDEPRLLDLAAGIEAEARRLDLRIQNLLDITRVRSGALEPRLDAVDPIDIANAALDAAADRLREHHIERDFGDDLPLTRVDAVLIEQALINILENAAKFSPAGSAIVVAVHAMEGMVTIDVRDRGAGLDAAESEQIFERFHRGERHADIAGGSGLGLTIAKVFVEANGGTIEALSAGPGQGTTMRVGLPRMAQAAPRGGDDDD
jgi:two-component system sensor histidine kinase KdpD